MPVYDLAVVGAGIVGLAHAYAAARRGKSVVVIDRDAQANGASVRNFGFVTVTGQGAGDCWTMARRARDIWAETVEQAGIAVVQRGMVLATRLEESEAVIDAFLRTEMGEGCARITATEAQAFVPCLRPAAARVSLHSPYEIRVESRTAIPLLARFLAEHHGVTFLRNTAVIAVEPPRVETARGVIEAETVVVCPGDDFTGLFADRIATYGVTRCKLQMLRLRPASPVHFKTAVMSDLGLGRYLGYAELPEAGALKKRLDADLKAERDNGIHLIVTQSADGSLVVGDSHHYAATPDPFASDAIDDLILAEFDRVLDMPGPSIAERWLGTYASAPDRWRFTDRPSDSVRIVVVTAGCGASTAFGIGEETINELYGSVA
ncbi:MULTISPECIES: TIGR03364 family FAD-dependent oxidoreductase [unclassified Rhizobium]|uniref:TIGR03364 family FAD-dependent oxidoreductase n=1 Tax=unclassified Rhizobium TaxID=2613769 RepID=UPI0007134F0B|nr:MULTISPECIES: TIGR03364 family FAD-dependent oxidoreductase [unclassified Rhizobium]KQS90493.1 FAD-dependent oxidoreductase [Rhizobium sp. Leaf386]KQS90604.1 FAD-dependent oxidoreductase [Rhizobium sp. Leaf391]KQU10235.1 FAD-dependent oxidoreductase [Rhizobium sp. Leaf453]